MSTTTSMTIRRMAQPDIDLALDWAAREGWDPGLDDGNAFFAADPQGFFLGELDGTAVGVISAVAYDERFAFLGLYIVHPEYRGQGYGRQLWHAAMQYAGTRHVGLDGVVAEQANYRKSGFRLAYRNIRYKGVGGKVDIAVSGRAEYVPLRELPRHELVAYDRTLFPAARPRFLDAWVFAPGVMSLGAVRDGRLAGYGVLRPCRVGYKFGPVFAEDESIAEEIFCRLATTVPGETLFLDVPEPNDAATALARRHAMTPVFETARMCTGPSPTIDLQKVFGVTTFELG